MVLISSRQYRNCRVGGCSPAGWGVINLHRYIRLFRLSPKIGGSVCMHIAVYVRVYSVQIIGELQQMGSVILACGICLFVVHIKAQTVIAFVFYRPIKVEVAK